MSGLLPPPSPTPHRCFRLTLSGAVSVYIFIVIWFTIAQNVPNTLWTDETLNAMIFIGFLGVWRYGWWLTNLVRSLLFGRIYYPIMRQHADLIWERGWRPEHVHFLMTTYHERPATTYHYLDSIVRELQREGLSGTLWIGFGAEEDFNVIEKWRERHRGEMPLNIVMVKQNQPGKRMAIGVILRALSRHGVGRDDVAFLMDGDAIMAAGALQKTLSIFGAYPEITALTTDEEAVVFGPKWVQNWLYMRFAQRRMWMQSHALSKRVLTLTGRMSAYRAEAVVARDFIRNVEADTLSHWLWGNFRFLSGDDKSTWYTLLKKGAAMTYVPDAMVYTIEHIEGWGLRRMRDNLLRWSGNMLRNGSRAIVLGPRVVPPFIWWCLVDQRISIWTVLAGFTSAMSIILFVDGRFLITYLLWISLTRFMLSLILFAFSDRIRISYPFLLYCNQLLSAILKVYIMFRLPKQRWTNRKAQKGGEDVMASPFRRAMAAYINVLYVAAMCFVVFLVTGILDWPEAYQLL